MKNFAEEYDSLINIAEIDENAEVKDRNVMDSYEKIRDVHMKSTILSVHLAGNFLAPNGYIALTSRMESFNDIKKE